MNPGDHRRGPLERQGDPETMELPEDRLKRRLQFLRAEAKSLISLDGRYLSGV